jgi:hypothetical protein
VGFGLGILVGIYVIITTIWFPVVWDDRYQQLRDFLFFSGGFFMVLVSKFGDLRKSRRFQRALLLFVVAHTLAIWAFVTFFGDISLRGYIFVIAVESYPAVFFIDWFAHLGTKNAHHDPPSL